MLLLLFFALVPIFRLITLLYRRARLGTLSTIYNNYIFGEPLKSKFGKSISLYHYQTEIISLMAMSGVSDFEFNAKISKEAIFKTKKAFYRAAGNTLLEIKRSFFPNTYLRYLADLPMIISRKVGITPSKSLGLALYILYIGLGYVDTATAIYKIIEILGGLAI